MKSEITSLNFFLSASCTISAGGPLGNTIPLDQMLVSIHARSKLAPVSPFANHMLYIFRLDPLFHGGAASYFAHVL